MLQLLSNYVAETVRRGMGDLRPTFESVAAAPGTYHFVGHSSDLRALCYVELGMQFAKEADLAICAYAACGRPFKPHRPNEKYCIAACGSNHRYKEYLKREEEKRRARQASPQRPGRTKILSARKRPSR